METNSRRVRRGERGFTLIELLIATLIGLFLVGGLLILVQDNRRTFASQSQLAQLQDAERLALTMMTDVIQAAGYFPDPTVNTANSALPAAGVFAVGQPMTGTGTYSAAGAGDTVTVRYTTADGDGVLNCDGTSNNTGANFTYVNQFSVVPDAGGNPQLAQLVCTMNGKAYPLITGVTNLRVLYGVNSAGTANIVDTYKNASQMAPADWQNVISVQVLLTFNNPLYVAANQGQPASFVLRRNIGVMNQTGI